MTTDTPLVTVVTPTLNRADTLERCLDSVAAQTYPRIEHIVVDGGSTDGSLELLSARAATGALRYVSGPDDGMYDAINKGLELSNGQVLAYLNSDDAYLPWTLELAVGALQDGAELAFGDLVRIERRPGGSSVSLQFYPAFDLNHYTHVGTMAQPTLVWRRSVRDGIGGFDASYRLLGDCEYWLRAGARGYRFAHVGDVQAVQIDHPGTLRVTQETRLREEFRRLRSDYRSAAGPPPNRRLEHARRSLRWRMSQWRLRREMARSVPRRWSRFIGFLRDQHVDVDTWGLLLFQLPERLRPPSTSWLAAAEFEHALDVAIAPHTVP